jgi:acetylglutamate kinase
LTPVIAPITHNGKGQLLNTNADTISQEIAKALAGYFETTLIYCFEKKGVLIDQANEDSIIPEITATSYKELKEKNIVFAGMLPKLDNAFAALLAGVDKVVIGKAEDLNQIISGEQGTSIVKG